MESIRVGPDDVDRVRGVPRNFSLGDKTEGRERDGVLGKGAARNPLPTRVSGGAL